MNTKRKTSHDCPDRTDDASLARIEQIRSKALELFAERGFSQVGMRELALRLGIGAGSFYHHFVSKEQMLFELIEELYEDLHDAATLTRAGSATQRLEGLLRAHIALHERRSLHFLMAEQELRNLSPAHYQQIRQMREQYESELLSRLRAAGAQAPETVLRACVEATVTWLNSLSISGAASELDTTQRLALTHDMVMGALSGVLPAAGRNGSIVVALQAVAAAQQA
ncbi:TetR/AcrR family transcriptional regulator [Pseudomonas zhanjiangensis]|uniref:TetR/AcrR family transcriptional regulator n=1 Tax=Pseudomonas zhanjiangensis TaxID=3239015 RepID=A0ABV3YZ93_9PSED